MAMRIRNELSAGKIFAGIAILAIMVSIGMAILQRTPNPAEGVLIVIFGIFIPMALSS
ncbi:MAG: hypothetical protein WAW15_01565 [Minisyncoccales bacterium]